VFRGVNAGPATTVRIQGRIGFQREAVPENHDR
jgi:hypothetical protein